jgi:hypothetical protein
VGELIIRVEGSTLLGVGTVGDMAEPVGGRSAHEELSRPLWSLESELSIKLSKSRKHSIVPKL